MTRSRDERRADARARNELRTLVAYLAAVIIGASLGIGIDVWSHL
jgi:hypothetical protein